MSSKTINAEITVSIGELQIKCSIPFTKLILSSLADVI